MSGMRTTGCPQGRCELFLLSLITFYLAIASSTAVAEVEIGGGLTMIGMGASGMTVDEADTGLNYSVDLELEGEVGDGTVFVYFNTSEGTSLLDGQENGDYEAGPADEGGFSSTGIAEAWYNMPLFESTHLTVGKIDPTGIYDGNEVANDQTTQFIALGFVFNQSIPFPAYTAGVNLGMEIGESMNFNVGLFEDEGLKGTMEATFTIAELGVNMEFFGGETNLRVTYWQNETADGFSFNADHNMEPLKFFLRAGSASLPETADDDVIESSMSLGLAYDLSDEMVIGAAYAQDTPKGVDLDPRTWMEAYISYSMDDDLAVSLDFQSVGARDFDAAADTVTIYGLRLQAGF